MNKIKFGWSEVSIVPEGRRIDLAGQFYERISGEVETPIAVTGLAIECAGDHMVFVACDIATTSFKLLTAVRELIPDDCGFDKEKLIISAIHTHNAFSHAVNMDSFSRALAMLKSMAPEGSNYIPFVADNSEDIMRGQEATDFIAQRIAKAAVEAWNNRKEGAYASGFGRAAIGLCRRVCYDDGSAKMWGDTNSANFTELESGNDSGIELLFTYDLDKKLTGVIANIACPAQVLEHQKFISSDYVGKVRRNLREKYGSEIKFLCMISPAGDMCPRDMVRWVPSPVCEKDPNINRETVIERRADPSMFEIKGCELAARRVTNEILWALEDVTEFVTETEFKHKTITLDMPLRRVTIAEYEKAKSAITNFFDNLEGDYNFEDSANLLIHSGVVSRFELQKTMNIYPIEVHIARLGDIALATNPYELFLNYGNQIRARSLAKQTFLCQLACGSFGYLPTERAERGGHYSAFVGSGSTGHVGGEILVRKTLSEINEMFK